MAGRATFGRGDPNMDKFACNKRDWGTWPEAEKAAKRTNRQHDERLSPYKCPVCHGIHVGTSQYRNQSRRARRLQVERVKEKLL